MRGFIIGVVFAVAALIGVGVVQSVLGRDVVRPGISDFRVVYCGEQAIRQRQDPYLTEPLRSCEQRVARAEQPDWAVTPFPLPGYDGALFLPFGIVPFAFAKLAWLGMLVLAFAVTASAVATIIRVPAWLVALVFAPTLGFLDFIYGEPVNIAIAAVALAALAIDRDRPRLAAIAAALAMIEPHIGLPACLGVFMFVGRARITLAGAAVVFAALAVLTLGIHENIEYFTTFLPQQAHAEIYAVDQFSLTRLLFVFGVDAKLASELGAVSYIVAIGIGLLVAPRFVRCGLSRALLLLVPVATAMFGGAFIHDVEIVAALPAALVIATRSRIGRCAVSLLAVPWGYPVRVLIVIVSASALALATITMPTTTRLGRILYTAGVIVVLIVLTHFLPVARFSDAIDGPPPVPVTAMTPSSVPWEWEIRLTPSARDMRVAALAIKLPTWFGLAMVPFALIEIELAFRRRRSDAERELGSAILKSS